MSYEIIEAVRRQLDERLLTVEQKYEGCRAFFARTCHLCPKEECTKIEVSYLCIQSYVGYATHSKSKQSVSNLFVTYCGVRSEIQSETQ